MVVYYSRKVERFSGFFVKYRIFAIVMDLDKVKYWTELSDYDLDTAAGACFTPLVPDHVAVYSADRQTYKEWGDGPGGRAGGLQGLQAEGEVQSDPFHLVDPTLSVKPVVEWLKSA